LLDPSPVEIAMAQGAVPLPSDLVQAVLNQWFNLTCLVDGSLVLQTEFLPQHQSAAFPVVLAISMVLWVLSLGAVAASWQFSSKGRTPLFYAICLAFGASSAFASVVVFYQIPEHTYICQLRQWLLCFGLTLLLGVMFARGWQLHSLHSTKGTRVAAGSDPRNIVSVVTLYLIVGGIFGVQLLLLILWTAIDPLKSTIVFSNTVDLNADYECASNHTLVWLLLELGFFLCLLGWGMYVVYRTWSSRASVDSRWTLIAVYNTLMAILVVIPLLATAANSDDWIFFLAALSIDFAVTSAVLSIYGSALLRKLWDSVRQSGSHSRSAETPSTFRAGQTTSVV